MFGVRPQELTRAGLNQCHIIGDMLREEYVIKQKLMQSEYTPESVEWYFQARGETRHQQSMSAITEALFPIGTGLSSYPKRMQPVPYFSWDKSTDPILHPPKLCQACRYRDDARWTQTKGTATVDNNMAKVEEISRVCGFNITSARVPSAALKDIADGFGFLTYEGLSIPGMKDWDRLNEMVTQFSFDMFVDRLFGTSEQATYWTGDYVRNVAANMLQMIKRNLDERGEPARKLMIYTASRELLFGVSFFFNLKLHIPAKNTPTGAMPPGDAIIFELHMDDTDSDKFWVEVWNMFPPSNDPAVAMGSAHRADGRVGKGKNYQRQSYTIDGCTTQCPFDQFIALIQAQEKKTGTWQDICSRYTFDDLAREFPMKFGAGKPAGKHTPEAGLIGPPPGVHDSLAHRYTRVGASHSKYASLSLKPMGPVVKPVVPRTPKPLPKPKAEPKPTPMADPIAAIAIGKATPTVSVVEPSTAAVVEPAIEDGTLLPYTDFVLKSIEDQPWSIAEYSAHVLGSTDVEQLVTEETAGIAVAVPTPAVAVAAAETTQAEAEQIETVPAAAVEDAAIAAAAADAESDDIQLTTRVEFETPAVRVAGTDGVPSRDVASLTVPTAAPKITEAASGRRIGVVVMACFAAVAITGLAWWKYRKNRQTHEYEAVGLGSVEPFPAATLPDDEQ